MTDKDLPAPIDREPDDLERLLATSPGYSSEIRVDSFVGDVFAHPELREALEAFHDELLKAAVERSPGRAGGMAKFLLAYRFAKAGLPLRAMPSPQRLADTVWQRTMRLLGPAYVKAFAKVGKSKREFASETNVAESLPPVLIAPTIHGSRVLLDNADRVFRKIVKEFKRVLPTGGVTQFEDYARGAENATISAAERFDPNNPTRAKFTTFLHLQLWHHANHWFERLCKYTYVELDKPPRRGGTNEPAEGLTLHDIIPDIFGSYAPGGQRSVLPVPSDDWAAEGVVEDRLAELRKRASVALKAANLSRREIDVL